MARGLHKAFEIAMANVKAHLLLLLIGSSSTKAKRAREHHVRNARARGSGMGEIRRGE
jgi:hypothetical protein